MNTICRSFPLLLSLCRTPSSLRNWIDLRNAYHLVRIKVGDEWKTASPVGHFEYLVMPFGLTNVPAVFQVLVNYVLRDFLNRFIFVNLDDIRIFSRDPSEHRLHGSLVLQRLLKNKLFVKAEKCKFYASSVSFLGLIIKSGQVEADPDKIKPVSECQLLPKGSNCKDFSLSALTSITNFTRVLSFPGG